MADSSQQQKQNTFMDKRTLETLDLDWSQDQRMGSLQTVYKYTVDKTNEFISWYDRDARRKKVGARRLRITAIVFTALGSIFPVLTQIITIEGERIDPAWATVVLAVGAAAVGIDRFFGFSSAWIRSITTGMKLKSQLDAFQYEWEAEQVFIQQLELSPEQTNDLVIKCANFMADVQVVVQEETQQWVLEFQRSLQNIDDKNVAQRQANRTAALVVNVSNGDQCDNGWQLSVEGKSSAKHFGNSGVVNNLFPGMYRIRVEGAINQQSVFAETVGNALAGEITSINVTLT